MRCYEKAILLWADSNLPGASVDFDGFVEFIGVDVFVGAILYGWRNKKVLFRINKDGTITYILER